jgi:uncharacterized protein
MTIVHDPEQQCFIMPTKAGNAIVDYSWRDDVMMLTHAEVPEALRGTGAGGRLAQGVFEEVEAMGVKARPVCPYLVRVARSNERWRALFGL